jgi:hypothetical protein
MAPQLVRRKDVPITDYSISLWKKQGFPLAILQFFAAAALTRTRGVRR